MKKHFVVFMSPGTLFHETTQKEVASWDIDKAKKMAVGIHERHGATSFGFYFITRSRGEKDLDSKITATSPTYFLGGTVETLQKVKARATKEDNILISNMECNGWNRIITNTNSWKITLPLRDKDVVLDFNKLDKRL